MEIASDIGALTPELVLVAGAIAVLMLGVANAGLARVWGLNLAAVALLVAAGAALMAPPEVSPEPVFNGAVRIDALAVYAKVLMALSAAACLMIAAPYLKSEGLDRFEYPALILLAVLGLFIMVSAADILSLYIGLELQSLALYVLAAFNRDSLRAAEAGLKYFVLGAIASGLILYGGSLVYGFSGGIAFSTIAQATQEPGVGLVIGLVFVLCGLGFKVSAAPFHMWTPDVYEGAPTPVTAFFAIAPKVGALAVLARVLSEPFGAMEADWRPILSVLAVLSMTVGAFGALVQTNIKRLMAYSSIGNMGYALVALAAGGEAGVQAMLVYMTFYAVGVLGVFAVILSMRRSEGMVERIDDLSGLHARRPALAIQATLALLSVAGLPFLAGFIGKLVVFSAAVNAGMVWLAVTGLVLSVVAAAYYLNILRAIWFAPDAGEFVDPAPALRVTAGVCAALSFPVLLVFAGVVERWASAAAAGLF
ncbi:MAG: NADH-quinone oxidoreductase subunit NuoN [Maricaulaceae bacterium]